MSRKEKKHSQGREIPISTPSDQESNHSKLEKSEMSEQKALKNSNFCLIDFDSGIRVTDESGSTRGDSSGNKKSYTDTAATAATNDSGDNKSDNNSNNDRSNSNNNSNNNNNDYDSDKIDRSRRKGSNSSCASGEGKLRRSSPDLILNPTSSDRCDVANKEAIFPFPSIQNQTNDSDKEKTSFFLPVEVHQYLLEVEVETFIDPANDSIFSRLYLVIRSLLGSLIGNFIGFIFRNIYKTFLSAESYIETDEERYGFDPKKSSSTLGKLPVFFEYTKEKVRSVTRGMKAYTVDAILTPENISKTKQYISGKISVVNTVFLYFVLGPVILSAIISDFMIEKVCDWIRASLDALYRASDAIVRLRESYHSEHTTSVTSVASKSSKPTLSTSPMYFVDFRGQRQKRQVEAEDNDILQQPNFTSLSSSSSSDIFVADGKSSMRTRPIKWTTANANASAANDTNTFKTLLEEESKKANIQLFFDRINPKMPILIYLKIIAYSLVVFAMSYINLNALYAIHHRAIRFGKVVILTTLSLAITFAAQFLQFLLKKGNSIQAKIKILSENSKIAGNTI